MSRDGSRLLVWDDDKTQSVWDLTAGKRIFGPARHPNPGPVIFKSSDKAGYVEEAALSPDGRRLAVGIETTGTLSVWDVDAGTIRHHNRRFRGYLYVLKFTADGRGVLTYTSDNLARLYDADTGEPAGPPVRQSSTAEGCDVTPDGQRLAVVDKPADMLRVWDVARGERLLSLPLGGRIPGYLWFHTNGRAVNSVISGKSYTFPLPKFEPSLADAGKLDHPG